MALHSESKYPNRRTYVLKLRGDATPEAFTGRVENLITGHQREFRSAGELVALIVADLVAAAGDPTTTASDA